MFIDILLSSFVVLCRNDEIVFCHLLVYNIGVLDDEDMAHRAIFLPNVKLVSSADIIKEFSQAEVSFVHKNVHLVGGNDNSTVSEIVYPEDDKGIFERTDFQN